MSSINALIISAMPEEMAPFQELLVGYSIKPVQSPIGDVSHARKGRSNLVLIVTGIGMTATAASLGWALQRYEPRAIVSIGSAGGLAADSRVGNVVIGTDYVNGGADATAFGYAPGQVPSQPATFPAGEVLLDAATKFLSESTADQRVIRWSSPNLQPTTTDESPEDLLIKTDAIRLGQMLSSDAFVTETNVDNRREVFPNAVTSDMESTSAAQVAHTWGVPFISIRGISDLCGKPDDQSVSFHAELSSVARSAAITAVEILFRSEVLDVVRSTHGPGKHFNQVSLKGALYLMLALTHNLDSGDVATLPDHVIEDLSRHTAAFPDDVAQHYLTLVAAGFKHASENPDASLTAKDYDSFRFKVLETRPEEDAPGNFLWPPTSQTIIKRFNGYWNDALAAIGLKPRRGRARGGLKFSERDYLYAVRSYVIYSEHSGNQASFNGYGNWLKETGQKGKLPSGAAIRQRFGSWKEALAAASGFEE